MSGIKSIEPESGGKATATFSEASSGANSGKQNENSLPLSPLQAAMKKYLVTNTEATAVRSENSRLGYIARSNCTGSGCGKCDKFAPNDRYSSSCSKSCECSRSTSLTSGPTNTAIKESLELLNPTATVTESFAGLNSRVPNLPGN